MTPVRIMADEIRLDQAERNLLGPRPARSPL